MDAMTDEFHDEASYGALLADEYDAIYGDVFDTEGAVDQLARLADGARILEFGVGTGRIGAPAGRKGSGCLGCRRLTGHVEDSQGEAGRGTRSRPSVEIS